MLTADDLRALRQENGCYAVTVHGEVHNLAARWVQTCDDCATSGGTDGPRNDRRPDPRP